MNGLDISYNFFLEYGQEFFEKNFSPFTKYLAFGLAGEGSECFGYDDELSEDHDFGPEFDIWIPEAVFDSLDKSLLDSYNRFVTECHRGILNRTPQAEGRRGIITIEDFFRKYTGISGIPEDEIQWLKIPETFIATAVNGKIFRDNYGEITRIRNAYMNFYPGNVLKKKLASRIIKMGQSGQYNYTRACTRRDYASAYMACGEFVREALGALFLLNRKYMPFYKWVFRSAEKLDICSDAVYGLMLLCRTADNDDACSYKQSLISEICFLIQRELQNQGYSFLNDPFLPLHGEEIMKGINNPDIASLPAIYDVR